MEDRQLRAAALALLEANHRDGYTLPAPGLYPFQWCWDSGPIALGWAAAGRWDTAWTELDRLLAGQWPSGMVPHIIFWRDSDDYFPGPKVWQTGLVPPRTGLTQPPLPISAAARLYAADPDRARAERRFRALWPGLVAWLSWIDRARRGPHGASVVVHPWESGMDNSPSWDQPLASVPEARTIKVERRDTVTVSARNRPSQREYLQYIGIVEALRDAGWDTERQVADSPFAVEDPCFTAITARAAADLATAADAAGIDGAEAERVAKSARAGLDALWDDEVGWCLPYDLRAGRSVGGITSIGLVALWAGLERDRAARILERLETWRTATVRYSIPTTEPTAPPFDPLRYWRGPIWLLTNWMAADGLGRSGFAGAAEELRLATRALLDQAPAGTEPFSEYFDPRSGEGIGGRGFSWTAALALAWLTA